MPESGLAEGEESKYLPGVAVPKCRCSAYGQRDARTDEQNRIVPLPQRLPPVAPRRRWHGRHGAAIVEGNRG